MIFEIVFHWDDGTEEVKYRRVAGSESAAELQLQVQRLQQRAIAGGYQSPYTWRVV